jgi:hypothetical protein
LQALRGIAQISAVTVVAEEEAAGVCGGRGELWV